MGAMILAVRPEPGLVATLSLAQELGLNAVGYPLFEVRAVGWECPDPARVDALLIGSANAIRHGGEGLARLREKPVHAVGQATAQAAREAGFEVASAGSGGLQNVLDRIAAPARLLRLSGAEHVALDPPQGVAIESRIVYETIPLELPEPLRALQELDLTVLLHSAAAAAQFEREASRMALHRNRISLAVIGPRVASALGKGWRAIHVSPAPNDRDLLEMVREVCI